VLIIIVLWSIAGGVFGAGFGWLLAETIGPDGTAGLILQAVSWIIVGHLIAGMLAGYFVLADRTQRKCRPTGRCQSSPFAISSRDRLGVSGVSSALTTLSISVYRDRTALSAHPEVLVG
jgi:hypothetical protein